MTQPESVEPTGLEIHPAAEQFPRMEGQEYEELKEDIRVRGLVNPIVKQGSCILDGRNRLRACVELGRLASYREYTGEDPLGFIIAQNILRRHLTDEQRAAILGKLRGPGLAADAEARMKSGRAVPSLSTQGGTNPGRTHEQLAREGHITEHKARTALQVAKYAPDILDDVIAGKKRLAEADKATKTRRQACRPGRVKKEVPLRERVERKFQRLMEKFTVQEYPAARAIIRELVTGKAVMQP